MTLQDFFKSRVQTRDTHALLRVVDLLLKTDCIHLYAIDVYVNNSGKPVAIGVDQEKTFPLVGNHRSGQTPNEKRVTGIRLCGISRCGGLTPIGKTHAVADVLENVQEVSMLFTYQRYFCAGCTLDREHALRDNPDHANPDNDKSGHEKVEHENPDRENAEEDSPDSANCIQYVNDPGHTNGVRDTTDFANGLQIVIDCVFPLLFDQKTTLHGCIDIIKGLLGWFGVISLIDARIILDLIMACWVWPFVNECVKMHDRPVDEDPFAPLVHDTQVAQYAGPCDSKAKEIYPNWAVFPLLKTALHEIYSNNLSFPGGVEPVNIRLLAESIFNLMCADEAFCRLIRGLMDMLGYEH